MIKTSVHDPILLLHSSCTGDHEAAASSERKLTARNDTGNDLSTLGLLEEPIFCDLLLLPEHPSSSFSHHDYLHLSKNRLNPCGISNVLTLEKLPKHWISGPVLLSLSSCNILYRTSNIGDDDFTVPIPLIIEPIPSTFVLDFSSEQDLGCNANEDQDHNERHNNSIITVKNMSEIFVALDVREASIQAKELLRHKNSTRIKETDDEGESRSEDDPKNHSEDHSPYKDRVDSRDTSFLQNKEDGAKGKEWDAIYRDRRPRLQNSSNSLNFDEAFTSHDLKEQALVLAHLNAQLDQGTDTINVILFMSGVFGILSMVILLWAIYQYYRTTMKSDLFSQEIRECMKTSHDMLQIAVNELNQYHNFNIKQHHYMKLSDKSESDDEVENFVPISPEKHGSRGDHILDISIPRGSFKTLSQVEHSQRNNSSALRQDASISSLCTDVSHEDFCPKGQKNYEDNNKSTLNSPSTQDNDTGKVCHNRDVAIIFVGKSKENEGEDKKLHLTTPIRNNNDVEIYNPDISSEDMIVGENMVEGKTTHEIEEDQTKHKNSRRKPSVPVQLPEIPSSPQLKRGGRRSFPGPFSAHQEHSFLKPHGKIATKFNSSPSDLMEKWEDGNIIHQEKSIEIGSPVSPCLQIAKNLNDEGRPLHCDRNISAAPLSPCSQLEKVWNEGKTTRRSNLKKRRQYLRPLFQSNKEPISISLDTTCKDDGDGILLESTFLSPIPKASKVYDRYYHQQQELSCNILGPPKLRSIARTNNTLNDATVEKLLDEVVKHDNVEAERNIINGSQTPPLDMVSQKSPHLCYTPVSEDDLFAYDYW